MDFQELKNKFEDLKENKWIRNLTMMALACGAVWYLFLSDTNQRTGPLFTPAPTSVFGVNEDIEQIKDFEVAAVVEEMNDRFLEKEQELTAQNELRDRQMKQMMEENAELSRSLFELSGTIRSISENSSNANYAPNTGRRNGDIPDDIDPAFPPAQTEASNTFFRENNQIVSQAPQSFGNDIIRTITQRSVAEVGVNGDVTIRDTGVITISERNRKVRDETVRTAREKAASSMKEEIEESRIHVLARGSLVSAIAINGVAAPTGNAAQTEPMPIMFRIKKDAIMPNFFTLDIRECHVLGTATGRLRDERVYIRTDSISCITEDGVNIDEPFMAVAVSRGDGLLGVPATKVFKGQELLTNSAYAGALSGFAQAIKPNQVQSLNTSPTASSLWQSEQLDSYAAAGVGQGVSNAADRIADFYLDLAEQVSPILEMLPGTEVDFMVIGKTTFKMDK